MQLIRESLAGNKQSPRKNTTSPQASPVPVPVGRGKGRARSSIRTLIAGSEPIAREVLTALLRSEPDIEIVSILATGHEAAAAINKLEPDLVFLDVQMPELGGFGVLDQIHCAHKPCIIFVSDDEGLAARAFEVQAADYLVKPCRADRLSSALKRVRAELNRSEAHHIHEKLDALLAEARPEKGADRIPVKSGGRIVFVRLADLAWIEAADNYVKLHSGAETHFMRETMAMIESRLASDQFVRISRSAIVNVEHIKELQAMSHGEYEVALGNGTRLTLTRGYREKLRQLCSR
jgi:two-component system LytT family response regulator